MISGSDYFARFLLFKRAFSMKKVMLKNRRTSMCQILSKSFKPRLRYGYFQFFKMGAAAILDFLNLKILTVGTVKRVELHLSAKFRQKVSNRGSDITIFRFFQDGGRPPSWICNACVRKSTKGIWWSLSLCKIWLESMQ